jgi:hypothetical protein
MAQYPAAAVATLTVSGLPAVCAYAAGRDARREYPVSFDESGDAAADVDDRAHGLVAEDPTCFYLRYVAAEDVKVGPADGYGVDLHDRVARIQDLGVGDLRPAPLTGTAVHHRFHRVLQPLDDNSSVPVGVDAAECALARTDQVEGPDRVSA